MSKVDCIESFNDNENTLKKQKSNLAQEITFRKMEDYENLLRDNFCIGNNCNNFATNHNLVIDFFPQFPKGN